MEHQRRWALALAVVSLAMLPTAHAQQYTEWSVPAHLDRPVNSEGAEYNPVVSRDGLTLYFQRNPGDYSPSYMYVSHRETPEALWQPPEYLGDVLGDGLFLSNDGHRAYFNRTAPDGKADLYISRRQDKNDDHGWSEPENLGPSINTTANEYYPSLYEDEANGVTFLYFASDRAGKDDIYAAQMLEDGTFGETAPVTALNTSAEDRRVRIRRDGLECVLMSNREGSIHNKKGNNSLDLWVATRASVAEPWSEPVNMGVPINTGRHEGAPSYSFDGSQLYFHGAQRDLNFDGGDVLQLGCPDSPTCYFDIWVVTRNKVSGNSGK